MVAGAFCRCGHAHASEACDAVPFGVKLLRHAPGKIATIRCDSPEMVYLHPDLEFQQATLNRCACLHFIPSNLDLNRRVGERPPRRAHNAKVAGSSPAPATIP